jgi:dimethylglycine dehydrogenase
MWSCDPRRFTGYETEEYCVKKGMEVYGHEYGMHFPMARWPAAPDMKLSPVHDRVRAAGGVMAPYNGWERAEWYAKPGDDTSWAATQTWGRAGPWEARIAAECAAVRDGVGVLDLPGFTRLRLAGPGARAHLNSLTASKLPQPGRIGLAYFADARGRIVTEMTVLPFSDDDVGVITASVAQRHDADLLRRGLPDGVTLEDWTDRIHCFIVTGPKARDLLAPITEGDLSLPWLSVQFFAKVAGRDVALIRVSFAGELGWEVHCDHADAPAIWDALVAGGAVPFGMRALNSLRIEKGYRAWKGDLSTDYSLLEGGLGRFIDWTHDFPGKAALEAEKQRGVTKRFCTLIVEAGAEDPPYMATIWQGDAIVGEVTSAAFGHRVGAVVALGMLRADLGPGTAVEVEVFGVRYRAVVQADAPVWDAKNERIRA